ncbi:MULTISPECIES: formate dehydrogenase subunit gamma [Comamonas]|uniref:formate dehydrogenase subunit gamma n=1 Tax=Comamonas TaxID=283 RepID=UPI00054D8174|nr:MULTISPECIES: formate dehydrogenase subunit gamma [Comamonas]TZG11070.1 formate dehydrogenase subunit gamma [Comamonas thiooxydans]UNV91971.1 formate dehydrogenase subunit gamma [Comamonas sp. 7D-2evo1]UNV94729.1 formate dehydrogenase subunit gamma [Comamonas sp. 7D-2]UNW01607.1 formate dehydrogenase subunit gamma [Comamonas sp. 7D-2evo2]
MPHHPIAQPQEAAPLLSPEQRDALTHCLARFGQEPGGLLPLLHSLQDALGFIPRAAVPAIAEALNLSRAEVHGVVSYYPHLREQPHGRTLIQICRAEACKSRGGDALFAHAQETLGCQAHGTSADGSVTLEPVYCLGLCAQSPAVMVDESEVHARMTADRLDALLEEIQQKRLEAKADEAQAAIENEAVAATRIYVPRDAAALAVGADAVAQALQRECEARGLAVELVRNGSRGLLWLETLVEVETAQGRVAYGPVQAADVPGLLDAGMLQGRSHALCHGLTEQMPYLARQERLTFARVGIVDPLSLRDYEAHGGWQGLRAAAAMAPEAIVQQVLDSGLRGRGGAAFPAGIKWKTVAAAENVGAGPQKYIACNADEGDSGTFADRLLMEGDPFCLIEGMAIAGLAVGATQGYIYVRSEYPHSIAVLNEAIARASAAGWLGANVAGSGKAFYLQVRKGAGSYVCGEETAMLESIEGKRGIVRAKPPLPAIEGLFGKPTVINNVITLATVPIILARGAAFYQGYGMGRSRGTLPFQLAGNIARGGLVEKAFGLTLRELVQDFGGGTASGRPIKAIQVGGPLGSYVAPENWDDPLDYEAYAAKGNVVGHGGLVVHDDSADMAQLARYAMEFCAIESCGKCTPCRIGSTRGVEVIDRITRQGGAEHAANVALLESLCDTMQHGSLCAMGGMTPYPVRSALQHYPQDFGIEPAQTVNPA